MQLTFHTARIPGLDQRRKTVQGPWRPHVVLASIARFHLKSIHFAILNTGLRLKQPYKT